MRVLVTGAAGRIGTWIVQELAAHGHSVVALDNRALPPEVRKTGATAIYADISDPLAMLAHAAGCDAIAHTAAFPSPWRVTPADLLRVNVIGTQNVLEAAQANDIGKVIVTSSVGALGFSFPTHPCPPDSLPVRLDHPRRPQDIYGLSKVMNEESAAAATRLAGTTTIVFRPPFVLDIEHARQNGWLQRMVGRKPDELDPSLWGYIDVRDLARAYRLALESDLTGHHVFYTMADDLRVDATPQELVDRWLPQLSDQAACLPGRSFYDLAPARDVLGFAAERTWREVMDRDAVEAETQT